MFFERASGIVYSISPYFGFPRDSISICDFIDFIWLYQGGASRQ